MTIDRPTQDQIPQLRALWKEAFGDTDAFLDIFFHRAYTPERCRCITRDGHVIAVLYWFDCSWEDKRLAYLYAVATAKSCRGQGLCRKLTEDTHRHLQSLGYDGCVLVPQGKHLFSLYGKFGYQVCAYSRQFTCHTNGAPIPIAQVAPDEYAVARRALLPKSSVLQEGMTLDFLSTYARLYTGEGFTLAAYPNEGKLIGCELLGNPEKAPQILASLGFREGTFRVPDDQNPFAMYLSLTADATAPVYLGLALD